MTQTKQSKEGGFLHNEFERQSRVVEAYIDSRGPLMREVYHTAKKLHNGKRKGGDPEFSHQVWIAHYILTMQFNLAGFDLDELIIIALLHDTYEDGYISSDRLIDIVGKKRHDQCLLISKIRFWRDQSSSFDRAANEVALDYSNIISGTSGVFGADGVNRAVRYVKIPNETYLLNLMIDRYVAIAKSVDRLHNLMTGSGVMSRQRLADYVNETHAVHIPMLRSFINAGSSSHAYGMMIEALEIICRTVTNTMNNKGIKRPA